MNSFVSNLPIIAIITPFAVAFIIGLTGQKNITIKRVLSFVATLVSLIAVVLLLKPIMVDKLIATYWMGSWKPVEGWAIGIGLEVDALSLFVGLIIAVTCFLSSIYSIRYMERDSSLEKYYTLFLLLTGSMLGFVFTGDLFNMYVMLEIMTFAAVALTSFRNNLYKSIEAGFKYIVIGSLGSSLILLGTVLLYAQVNTLNLAQISAVLYNNKFNPVTIMALAFLLTGYAVKAFLVPCHTWPPDAHMSAPSSISMLLSGVMSKTGVYGLIRVLYMIFHATGKPSLATLIIIWGTITMLVGVSMALVQTDFKRLLAFHSVSQLGYIMVGLGIGLVSTNEIAVLGSLGGLYHMLNHASFKCLLFLTAGAVLYTTGTTDLNKLGGLGKKMPMTTVLFMIGAFSISGIPPFNGFVSKWIIYQATYEAGYYWVTIIALIVSVMTLASFVKVGQSVFFGQRHRDFDNVKEAPWLMRIPMMILALICTISGVFPGFISKYLLEPAAYAMYNLGGYIDVMFGSGFAEKMFKDTVKIPQINYSYAGYWKPESWLVLFVVILIAFLIIVTINLSSMGRRSVEQSVSNTKYDNFTGGEEEEYSQVGGHDLFWGMKYQFRTYFDTLQKAHSGVVNDYVLWVIACLTIVIIYCFILL